jgi:hypothetical protein
MIVSVVVHLVVDVEVDRLVGVAEDVATGLRRRFHGAEELVAHLQEHVLADGAATRPRIAPAVPSADR